MRYLQKGVSEEISHSYKKVYSQYAEYRQFIAGLGVSESRKLDKALFSFGQFLKLAGPYT